MRGDAVEERDGSLPVCILCMERCYLSKKSYGRSWLLVAAIGGRGSETIQDMPGLLAWSVWAGESSRSDLVGLPYTDSATPDGG